MSDDDQVAVPSATVATTVTKVHRAPPVLNLELQSYVMWRKDIGIWQLLTSLPKNKQGLDLYMSLKQSYKS